MKNISSSTESINSNHTQNKKMIWKRLFLSRICKKHENSNSPQNYHLNLERESSFSNCGDISSEITQLDYFNFSCVE